MSGAPFGGLRRTLCRRLFPRCLVRLVVWLPAALVAVRCGGRREWGHLRQRQGGRGLRASFTCAWNPAWTARIPRAFGESSSALTPRAAPGASCSPPAGPRRPGSLRAKPPSTLPLARWLVGRRSGSRPIEGLDRRGAGRTVRMARWGANRRASRACDFASARGRVSVESAAFGGHAAAEALDGPRHATIPKAKKQP